MLVYFLILFIITITFILLIKNNKSKKMDDDGISLIIKEKDKIQYTPIVDKLNDFEGEFFFILNTHRLSLGLGELISERLCNDLAYEHTKYMISKNDVSHTNSFKRKYEVLRRGGKNFGECVAKEYSTPKSFLNAYLNSIKHKNIIESPEFTHIGIKVVKNHYNKLYNTLIFASFEN